MAKDKTKKTKRPKWRKRLRNGMFLFAAVLIAVSVGIALPYAGIGSAAAEGESLANQILKRIESRNRPVIAIDPGHGGTDPGSEGNGIWEYQMTWRVANELKELLEKDGRFAPVLTISEEESQNSDVPRVEPVERAQRANDAGAVLLVSIHGNSEPSGAARGFECYAIPPGLGNHDESLRFARLAAQEVAAVGQTLRGQDGVRYIYFDTYDNRIVRESSDENQYDDPTFAILRTAKCPAVLMEQCFLTNQQDTALMATEAGTKAAAQAYYKAICEWMESRPDHAA